MREAVIVSTARTPIGRAYRGAFNNTDGPTLGGHAIRHAVMRAGLDPAEVEDVNWGCALTQGSQAPNIARLAALAGGLPVTVGGMTVDRQCSSGMMAIAAAAKTIMFDGVDIMVGGGQDSISIVQNEHMNTVPYVRSRVGGPARKHLHADAGYGRSRGAPVRRQPGGPGRIRAAKPAAHGCRAGCRETG